MAAKTYAEARNLLLGEIEKMWDKKPQDVANLSNVLGAFKQSGSVKIYAHATTKQLSDVLTRLRVIHEGGEVTTRDISMTASGLLAAYAEEWPRYYRFKDAPKVLDEVAGCLKAPLIDPRELDEILKLAIRYVYRLCFWVDTEIPWKAVTDVSR